MGLQEPEAEAVKEELALRYYTPLVGAWSGRFSFVVTDSRALRARGAATSFPLRAFALFSRLGARMSTTLASTSDARTFEHTTRVTLLGLTLYETRESITIAEDGRAFTMTGTQRPIMGKSEPYEAQGEVGADASGATYHVTFYGADLTQRTRLVPDGLSLTQESPWTRASVVLMR